MPKPIKFVYEKQESFRDAFLIIIICEGKNREPDYFRFFDGISSRLQVEAIESGNDSAPRLLIEKALEAEQMFDPSPDKDQIWFVIDTDRWRVQLHEIRQECEKHTNWNVAQSNPCFEVWLYNHVDPKLPEFENIDVCKNWKTFLPTVIKGGFNPDFHPIAIEIGTENSKKSYSETGYFPQPGSTQLWRLGEEIIPLIKKRLDILKHKFPNPVKPDM